MKIEKQDWFVCEVCNKRYGFEHVAETCEKFCKKKQACPAHDFYYELDNDPEIFDGMNVVRKCKLCEHSERSYFDPEAVEIDQEVLKNLFMKNVKMRTK